MNGRELVEDYTRAPVPDSKMMSGWQIALVLLALGFTLPVFALGAQIAHAQGATRGGLACVAGCLLAGLLAIGPSVVGSRVRQSTYAIVMIVFGPFGGRLINILLAIVLLGWFANVADLLGTAVSNTLRDQYGLSVGTFACTGCALFLMTLTSIFGLRTIERFSMLSVPILCLFMMRVLWLAFRDHCSTVKLRGSGDGSFSMIDATSAVLGLVVLTAVIAPDFTRYARNDRAALLSVASLALGYPAIMMMGVLPAAMLQQGDMMRIMTLLGLPGIALAVLVLSTWTSNIGNLYCSTLTLSTLMPHIPVWKLGVGGAIVALLAAWFHLSIYFVPLLEVLGVTAAPIAAIYPCCYFLAGRTGQSPFERLAAGNAQANLIAWIIGAVVGYFSQRAGGFILPMPALEGLLTAFCLWLFLHRSKLQHSLPTR